MKNKSLIVMLVVFLCLLGVSTVFAGYVYVGGDTYSSICQAWYGDLVDQGPHYAYVDGPSGHAQASANGWDIGAEAHGVLGLSGGDPSFYISGEASFSQPFRVTQAGPASITFSLDGWMSIWVDSDQIPSDWGGSEIYSSFSVNISDSLEENWVEDSDTLDVWDVDPYTGLVSGDYGPLTYTLTYYFSDEDIGRLFTVYPDLEAEVFGDIDDSLGFQGEIYLDSNFIDTLELTGYSGGIAPVPIPGAVWLLGSGFIALVALQRRSSSD